MRRVLFRLAAIMLCLAPLGVFAAEGSALLSPEEMNELLSTYEPFLTDLEEKLVARGLLDESDRQRWHNAQLGDFFSNGAYGSILVTYLPGALDYVREEEMALNLSCLLPCGNMFLSTMRRYSPGDSAASGLPLTFTLTDPDGLPLACDIRLDSTAGIFSRWDVLTSGYQTVGTSAISEGETLIWSAPVPAAGAADAYLSVTVLDSETGEEIGHAILTLRTGNAGYVLDDDALRPTEE